MLSRFTRRNLIAFLDGPRLLWPWCNRSSVGGVRLQPGQANYDNEENVAVDVSWPFPRESGTAFCAVTVKRGDSVMSKSRMQLKVEGPGRSPWILAAEDIRSDSVRLGGKGFETFVLLEFVHKSHEAVKKLAKENYGNQVRIRDSNGHLTDGGRASGEYKSTGIALDCGSEDAAKQLVTVLRGETSR